MLCACGSRRRAGERSQGCPNEFTRYAGKGLYLLTQFLKLYAIRLKQQRFAILSYARNPCPEAMWINLEPHFSDYEAVIRFWHC
jgi:hypothetical protein